MGEATKTKTSRRTVTGLRISDDLTLPLEVAVESLGILGTKGSGKSSTAAVLCEELWDAGVQFVVLDPTGVFWGLRSSADGEGEGIAVVILGGPHGDAPLEPTAGALIADVIVDTGRSLVLDLSDFPSKAAQTRFATDLAERLYRRKARARTPLHIVLDEAEEFIPQDVRGEGARMVGAWETIVALGRSRGLGETLISRRVQAVNKKVLDLIETMLAMRTGAPLARKRIEEWIEAKEVEDEAGVVSTLKELPTGTAWVWSPLRGQLVEVPIRRIRTFDSYETPKPGQTPREARVLAEIDLQALGAQIAATAEQAKENDPAELRKRLRAAEDRARGLEQQVEEWKREAESRPTEVERVEVPAFTVDDLDEVWKLVRGAKDAGDALTSGLDAVAKPLAAAIVRAAEAAETRPAAPARLRETTQRETPAPASPTAAPGPRPGPRAVPERDASGGARTNGLPTGARHLLTTLADNHPLRLTVGQLAMLARRKPRGGAWNTAMKTLREGGYVVEEGAEIVLTDHGIEATGAASYLTATQMVQRWREALPAAALDIFDLLVQAHPNPVTIDDIAGRTGRAARGGSWNSAVATLVRNGLAEKTTDGLVATERAMGD